MIREVNDSVPREYFARLDRLPQRMRDDVLARENLKNLETAALCRAGAALCGMRTFMGNVRKKPDRPEITEKEVPPSMVRDVALPGCHVPEF